MGCLQATAQLEQGADVFVLLGSLTDAAKFQECMSSFALAACAQRSTAHLGLFAKALRAAQKTPSPTLDKRVMEAFAMESALNGGGSSLEAICRAETVNDLEVILMAEDIASK